MKRTFLIVVSLVFVVTLVFSQPPKKESEIPGYPGARLLAETQSPTKAELASGTGPDFAFRLERTYSSSASVEQIAQFYARKWGVEIGQDGGADPNDLNPGDVSSVGSSVEYFDPDFIDQSPDQVRAAFEKRAKLPDADGWARSASFAWAFKDINKDPYSFSLVITDTSIPDEGSPRYTQGTEIKLEVSMFSQERLAAFQTKMANLVVADPNAKANAQQAQQAQADASKAAADKMDAEMKSVEAAYAKAPTERDLGVTIYSGARYDAEQSLFNSGFSTDKDRNYVFQVDVKPSVLAKYYEQHTGNARVVSPFAANAIIVPINFGTAAQKGDTPPMKDFVTIAGSDGEGKAILIITKRSAAWTGNEGAGK